MDNPFELLPDELLHHILVTLMHDRDEEMNHHFTTICVVPCVCKRFRAIVSQRVMCELKKLERSRSGGLWPRNAWGFFKEMGYASLVEWRACTKYRFGKRLVEELDRGFLMVGTQLRDHPRFRIRLDRLRGKEFAMAKCAITHGRPIVFHHFFNKWVVSPSRCRHHADKLFNHAMAHMGMEEATALLECSKCSNDILCSEDHLHKAQEWQGGSHLATMIKARITVDTRRIFRRAVYNADLAKVQQMIERYGFEDVVYSGGGKRFIQGSIDHLGELYPGDNCVTREHVDSIDEWLDVYHLDYATVVRHLFVRYPTLKMTDSLFVFAAGQFALVDFLWAWELFFFTNGESCPAEERRTHEEIDAVVKKAFRETCCRRNLNNLMFIEQHPQYHIILSTKMMIECMDPAYRLKMDAAHFMVRLYQVTRVDDAFIDKCNFVEHCIANGMKAELVYYLSHVPLDEDDINRVVIFALVERAAAMLEFLLFPKDPECRKAFGHFTAAIDDDILEEADEMIAMEIKWKRRRYNPTPL